MEEIWKQIPNFSNYYASTYGKIKNKKDKIISSQPNHGYLRVSITNDNGKRISVHVHRLIGLTFIPNPENKETINHKNHNKTDNNVNNLEWASMTEQNHHKKPIPKDVLSKGQNKEIWRVNIKTGEKIEKYSSAKEASLWLFNNKYTQSKNALSRGCPSISKVANKLPKYESAFTFGWEWDNEKENLYDEIWKVINPDFINESQNYQVSNYGRIKTSRNRISEGHKADGNGYIYIRIQDKKYGIHRLVAYMFIENDDPENKIIVHHKDDNPSNNHMSNLEWTTSSQNTQYSADTGKLSKCKKKIIQYNIPYLNEKGFIIMEKIKEFESTISASKELNITRTLITNNLCNNQHTAGGYVFLYSDKILNDELKKDLLEKTKNYNKTDRKSIIQYDLQMNKIKEYNTLTEASNELNIDVRLISCCVRDKILTTNNKYIFKYASLIITDEIKKDILNKLNNKKNTKKIIQYDLKMNKVKEFNSINEASKELGIHKNSIGLCLNGKQQKAGKKFKFKYMNVI